MTNENIVEFPKEEVIEKTELENILQRLSPQGNAEKVKKHIETLIGILPEIKSDGFDLYITDTLNDNGTKNMATAGGIEIRLTSSKFDDLDIPLMDESFESDFLKFEDRYPTEQSIKDAYHKARSVAREIVGKRTLYERGERVDTSSVEIHKKAA